jgi:hypothetical protein
MHVLDMGLPLTVVGIAALLMLIWFWQHSRDWRPSIRLLLTALLTVFTISLFLTGGVLYWYTHRPIPDDFQTELYDGVMYYRDVRLEPRPVIIHVITIDLQVAHVRFAVTKGDLNADRRFRAQTTSDFLAEYGVQIAINGDFFDPWWNDGLWDYYPHRGDGVNVFGLSSTDGVSFETGRQSFRALYMSADQVPSFEPPPDEAIYNAISGNVIFVEHGEYVTFDGDYHEDRHPRTAIALNQSEDILILVVVDGRQPNYSEGLTMQALADLVIEYGGYTALNLDGGGSSTLVIEDENGHPDVLNSPIDNRIPGRERPVANHLGIFIDE